MLLPRWLRGLAALPLLALALIPAPAAYAQEGVPIATLVVRVWPEYDEPTALVIYEGRAAPDVSLPVDVRLPLPPAATLHASAYIDTAGGSLLMAQTRQEGGEAILTSPNGSFWLEFYDPALEKDGETRRYELALTAPAAIGELVWEVELPVGGRNLEVEPAEGGSFITDANDLPAFRVSVGAVEAGETVTLRFTYAKSDDALTADQLPSIPPSSDAATAPPAVQAGAPSPLVLALILAGGLALVGGGVYWYVSRTGGAARRAGRAAAPRQPARRGKARFCTQCGQPAGASDRFCRHCGAKLGG